MKHLALFILTAAACLAEVSTRIVVDGTALPAAIAGVPWIQATNYASRGDSDMGMGVSYRGEHLKIDLYVYDSLNADWSKLPLKQRIERENEAIADIFRQFTENGDYSDVKIKPMRVVTHGDREFMHTEIDFTDRKAGALNSHYYLAELNGRILKIRISRDAKSPASAESVFKEIANAFSTKAGGLK